MSVQTGPERDGLKTLVARAGQTEGLKPRHENEFLARAKTTGRQIVERLVLRPHRELARQASVGLFSGALMLTTLFHPLVGATPAAAAAATPPASSSQVVTVSDNQSQAQQSGFTVAAPSAPAAQNLDQPTPDISTPDKFIAAVVPAAQASERETHVPAAVTIAQAILESDWGRSQLSTKAQNYFGIKAASGPGPAGVVNMDTWEVFNGQNTVINDGFKAYHNLYESVMDHGRFLANNPRYADAFQTSDPKVFAQRMHQDGYATDPDYSAKVNYLIDHYNLEQYDLN